MITPQQRTVFFLTCVLGLMLLSPAVVSAGTPEAAFASVSASAVWDWVLEVFRDQGRMIQIGAVVVVAAIFLLVRK